MHHLSSSFIIHHPSSIIITAFMGVLFPFAPVGSQVPGLRIIQIVLCLKVSGVIFFGTRNCQKVSKQQEPKPIAMTSENEFLVQSVLKKLRNQACQDLRGWTTQVIQPMTSQVDSLHLLCTCAAIVSSEEMAHSW